MCDADGAGHRQLTASGLRSTSPRWSPDGMNLAFVSNREHVHEHAQILIMPVDGGEPRALTRHSAPVGDFAWSPDGASIAFAATDPKNAEREADEEAGRDWIVAGEQERHRRLWLLDVATGATRPLYEDELTVLAFVWSPDGTRLVMRTADTPGTDDGMMAGSLYALARRRNAAAHRPDRGQARRHGRVARRTPAGLLPARSASTIRWRRASSSWTWPGGRRGT